jgi:DNA-binding MarR family transcriptional regulator
MQSEGDSGDLAADLSAALERTVRMLRSVTPSRGLSYTSVLTLGTLARTGPRRLTSLAESEGVTQPAMTQVVARLLELGLVTRTTDPDDKRVVLVEVTDAGRAEIERRRAVRAEMLRELLAKLSSSQRDALQAAMPVLDALTRMQP